MTPEERKILSDKMWGVVRKHCKEPLPAEIPKDCVVVVPKELYDSIATYAADIEIPLPHWLCGSRLVENNGCWILSLEQMLETATLEDIRRAP